VLVGCHAGCNQERVIAALRTRGLWAENSSHSLSRIARRTSVERKPDHDDARRCEALSPSGNPPSLHRERR
jgi:hypothetical protein